MYAARAAIFVVTRLLIAHLAHSARFVLSQGLVPHSQKAGFQKSL